VGHKEFGNLLIRDCTIAVNVYTTEYYSTIKKNTIMSFARMDRTGDQKTDKDKYYMFSFLCGI
jgi:hypothetical protein